ncbi:hypothetical protein R4I43_29615 [Saccharopolyspora sp. S2-29]|uniref:Uncharacterized protein n=1 Tax=Saccharopolyspora mangrovi TaxID=3082379 RepID=A0ABU6AJ90_9PSEU|nr:hypothetical protein [Saccharopolyspora sp. S2-29]MEB3371568.1 hypothetical protein [Saccharopolyspora sp. S2-29]
MRQHSTSVGHDQYERDCPEWVVARAGARSAEQTEAVVMATVALSSETRMTAATTNAVTISGIVGVRRLSARASPIQLVSRTELNMPPTPMTSPKITETCSDHSETSVTK